MRVLHALRQKSVHLPHKEGRGRASEYLGRVHIDIVGPMPVKSVGGREYVYVIVDDYTQAVYTRPFRLRSEAAEAFKTFKEAAENESGNKLREVMTDNACELSIGREVRDTIGVLTNDSGLQDSLWAETFNTATYVHNRTPTKALDGRTSFEVRYGAKPDLAHSGHRAPSSSHWRN